MIHKVTCNQSSSSPWWLAVKKVKMETSRFNYEQPLFPLRDSWGKRTRERARNRPPRWNVTAAGQARHVSTTRPIFAPARLFVSLDYPWAERETARSLGLCLHGAGPEPSRTKPDRIGYCLHGTVWNRSRCLHGSFLEPARNGSITGPTKQQVQFWIRSGPVPERSRCKQKGYPVRCSDQNRLEPIPRKHSLGHDLHLK